MNSSGWVALWRTIFTHWVSDNKPWCDGFAWCYLYSKANHKKGTINFRNQYIAIERGEFITSKLKLQKLFGWTYSHVNIFLNALKMENMITIRTTNRFIHITIINYDTYQFENNKITEQNNEQSDEQMHEQTPNRHRTERHKQEVNNDNNIITKDIEKEKSHSPSNCKTAMKKKQKSEKFKKDAQEILDYLNAIKNSKYSNLTFIIARLKEGATIELCKKVIITKFYDDYFIDNPQYLNPETLFRPRHWDNYSEEARNYFSDGKMLRPIEYFKKDKSEGGKS